jgi:hypothetical protein
LGHIDTSWVWAKLVVFVSSSYNYFMSVYI